jgi:hypothetical protein
VDAYETRRFTHAGREFVAEFHHDPDMEAPWKVHDGHGPVRETRRNDWSGHYLKRPGEVIIWTDGRGPYHGTALVYDFAEACKIARRDGWNAEPYDVPSETPRQRAAKAARADMARLRAWLRDEWHWCGVTVRPAGACRCCGPSQSLWGIESDAGGYFEDVMRELADELIAGERAAA